MRSSHALWLIARISDRCWSCILRLWLRLDSDQRCGTTKRVSIIHHIILDTEASCCPKSGPP